MPVLTIDQHRIDVAEGTTLLQAARTVGIHIPTLCYRNGLAPTATCMVCAVKVEGRAALQPACATQVVAGMQVTTTGAELHRARQQALELLLSDHVGDCVAPCQQACPASLSVPTLVRAERHERAVPCHACSAPCERACRRARRDHAVSIRAVLCARIPQTLPMPTERVPRAYSVHMGHMSDEEYGAFARGAAPYDRIVPANAETGFTADETAREAKRCLHCDCRKPDHCDLRDLASAGSVRSGAWRGGPRRAFEQDASHPLVIYESGKCIACGACIKTAAAAGEPYGLCFVRRGFEVRVAPALGVSLSEALQCSAAACATACPTGALAMKDGPS